MGRDAPLPGSKHSESRRRMSSSNFEMRSAGMASGLVVLLEFGAGFALGVDVKNDAVWVLNGKTSISPRMVFERHDSSQTGSSERLALSIHVRHTEVVGQADRIAGGLIGLRRHELKRRAFSKFEIDVPAAVKGDLRAKIFDVEIAGLFDLRCDDAGGQ
jgi:hypothetical protein